MERIPYISPDLSPLGFAALPIYQNNGRVQVFLPINIGSTHSIDRYDQRPISVSGTDMMDLQPGSLSTGHACKTEQENQ